jgi:hypothetical protein
MRMNFGAVPPFDVLNEKLKKVKADRLALKLDTDSTGDLKILVLKNIFFLLSVDSFY